MSSRTRFYLDKRNAKWKGVCAGLADFTGIEAIWWRVGAVLATLSSGGMPIVAYFLIAWLADTKPEVQYEESNEEKKFWRNVRIAPSRSIRDVHASFRDIDRRVSNIERHYTSQNTRLAAEIDNL